MPLTYSDYLKDHHDYKVQWPENAFTLKLSPSVSVLGPKTSVLDPKKLCILRDTGYSSSLFGNKDL